MAIKKSELYSSIWESCGKLRGAIEPSEYKNYVLVILFVKYVSDRYGKMCVEKNPQLIEDDVFKILVSYLDYDKEEKNTAQVENQVEAQAEKILNLLV